jgi:signal peptidase I
MKLRATDAAGRKKPAPGTVKKKSFTRENLEAVIVAVVLALVIRNFVVQAFKIPSGSMEQTLLIGDHILVNKFLYGLSNQIQIPGLPDITYRDEKFFQLRRPRRGDVVVFIYPGDETKDYIKRVVAVEGETIEIRNKQVLINGKPYDTPQAQYTDSRVFAPADPPQQACRDQMKPVTVPKDHLFVMGDNRDHSADSRYWGFVNVNKVRGKAFIIYWSWEDFFKNFRPGRIGTIIE